MSLTRVQIDHSFNIVCSTLHTSHVYQATFLCFPGLFLGIIMSTAGVAANQVLERRQTQRQMDDKFLHLSLF